MTATLRWNPKKRIVTLLLSDEYTLDEYQQVNALLWGICQRDDFEYASLVVVMDNVQRPKFSPVEARKHTDAFRENDLREMVVVGLPGFYRGVAELFRGAIERAVGMPLSFASSLDEATRLLTDKQMSRSA